MSNQQHSPVQQQAAVVLSLLEDVEQQANQLSPQSPTSRERAQTIIQGDLRLAKRQAASISGDGGDHLQAVCLYTEAALKARFAGTVKNRQYRADLTEASQLLEKAIGRSATPHMYSLLGNVYTELGRFAEARKALTEAAESGQGEAATEARKNLLRLGDIEREAKDPLLRFLNYAEKHTLSTIEFFLAAVFIVINYFSPFALLPFLAFFLICAGIFNFFKESFGKT